MAEYREILVVRISKLKGYTAYGSTPFYLISRLIKLHNRWGFLYWAAKVFVDLESLSPMKTNFLLEIRVRLEIWWLVF